MSSNLESTSTPLQPNQEDRSSQGAASGQQFSLPLGVTPPAIKFTPPKIFGKDQSPEQSSAATRSTPATTAQSSTQVKSIFQSSRSSSAPVFHFGEQRDGPFARGDTNADTLKPAPAVRFGSADASLSSSNAPASAGSQSQTSFSFRVLHNITPLPSPQPSPRLAARYPSSALQPINVESKHTSDEDGNGTEVPQIQSLSLGSNVASDLFPAHANSLSPPRSTAPALSLPSRPRSVSDISIVSEREGGDYDIRDEATPAHRFFTPGFQAALHDGVAIARDTVAVLEKATDLLKSDQGLNKLYDDAKELRAFRGSDVRRIAILGDSGEGKSSLINSLLHVPGIAKTGDIGSACTSVVTEYYQKAPEHTAPFTIEVEHLSAPAIDEMINELVWSYRRLYMPSVESESTSAAEYAQYVRESAQAWSALESAFGHHREFREEMLRDMSDGALERATDKLTQWSREIEWPGGGRDGHWQSTADTADDCCKKTGAFMEDKYWPFTKVIRVYLNAQVLKTGVVLADLPGLQDSNLARVKATQDYLMRCSNIFIVAKISRAITDQSLKSSLFSVLSRHVPLEWEESGAKSLNVAVVCTRSEDINERTACQAFVGPGKRIEPSVMEQLETELAEAKSLGNKARTKALKRRREWLLIEARNNHVKEGLQRAYAAKVPAGHLDVFCVSNKSYEKYVEKENTSMIVASGIPDLRRFCHSLTADAQLREARHFLQSRLFSVLNSLEIWTRGAKTNQVATSFDESKFRSECNLAEKRRSLHDALAALKGDFQSCFSDQILELLEDKRYPYWEKAAAAEEVKWETWHWTQFNAWCLNNGNHSTPKRGHEDWNAKIIWKMRTELDYQWDLVEDEISVVFEQLLKSTEEVLASLRETVLESSPVDFRSSLASGIESRMADCKYKLQLSEQDFTGKVRLVRRYTSESNYNSFILGEMLPGYRHASDQSGTGKSAAQKSIIRRRVTGETLFPNVSISMQRAMDQALEEILKPLRDLVETAMNRIESDLNAAMARTGPKKDFRAMALVDMLAENIKSLKVRAEITSAACGN